MIFLIDGQTLETDEIDRGIGIYFKNVLYNLIAGTAGNIWYIAVSSAQSVAKLDPWLAGRLNVLEDSCFAPSTDYSRADAYTDRINEIVAEHNVDVFWSPNPLMVNVLFPNKKIKCRHFATVHDLIPLIRPVKEWSRETQSEYDRRLDYLKEQNVHLLCNSQATEHDVHEHLGNSIPTTVTFLASNQGLFFRPRKGTNTTNSIKVVFTGGFDPRKNMLAAVEAFAKSKRNFQDKKVQLIIVCKCGNNEREAFYNHCDRLGVRENVRLTGFIPDAELSELYAMADVFFFPSLYEGFGLPLLEAMLGGCYILSADNSSLPEVCGCHALYCDAEDTDDMAKKLLDAIDNSLAESLADKRQRQEYARQFTWSKTAEQTFMAMKNSCRRPATAKKRIAIVSSWPNQQTGIANFTYRLMPYLAEYFDVDIFIDNSVVSDVEFVPYDYGSLYFINELEKRHLEYDKIIYHIGNNASFHKGTYLMMRKYPGTAEIHDFNLNGLFHSFFEGDKPALLQAFVDGYGAEGEREFAAIINGGRYANSLPMSHSVAAISDMAIVHNEWSWHALKSRKAALVPHPCFAWQPPEPKEVAFSKVQEIIRKRQGELVIAVFGYMGNNRRLSVVLGAFWRLSQKYTHIKLAFFGTCHNKSALRFVSEHNLGGRFFITGYLEPSEYDCALALTDICVNLRYPSMGESSGTLCQQLKAGKPVIVSELNQYTEFPDEVCWKVPVDSYEEHILRKMFEHLITHEETRQQLGANAKRYADTVLTCENIAEMYARVL